MGGTHSSPSLKAQGRPTTSRSASTHDGARLGSGVLTVPTGHAPLTQPFIPVLTKALVMQSCSFGVGKEVHVNAFLDLVFPDTRDFGKRLFMFLLASYHDGVNGRQGEGFSIPEKDFVNILDAKFQEACGHDNYHVFLTLFSEKTGLPIMTQESFREFLFICYEAAVGKLRSGDDEEQFIVSALVNSAFHQKKEVNIGYLQGWLRRNCPRILEPLVKFVVHRLSTAHESAGDAERRLLGTNEFPIVVTWASSADNVDRVVHRALVWILCSAMPESYSKPNKSLVGSKLSFPSLSEILTTLCVPRDWSVLYNTDDHGMAMNRFIHHVMKYRGPTIMVIDAEYGYRFCLGIDEEWKDTGSYWGKEESVILEIAPEMHVLASGSKIICFNSSIRGYPLGLSLGPDTREPLIRIGDSWDKVEFKKIPLSIVRIIVLGTGEAKLVETQEKLRKARDDFAIARRVVDRRQLLEDYEVDRQILSMGSAPSNFNADRFRRPHPE